MCLAIPFKLKKIDGCDAIGEVDGVSRAVRVDFIDAPQPGDYVMVHAGFAIERLDPVQAEADIAAWREVTDALS